MTEPVPTDVVADIEHEHRAIWGRTAVTYVDGVETLTESAVGALLDAVGAGTGTTLLDVGTGPGTLIGAALDRGALVQAVDLTPEMVELARQRFPDAEIRIANASALPFADQRFDAVTLPFCLHHMAQPAAALAEARRVLRPGGRVGLTVWAPDEQLEAFGLAMDALGGLAEDVRFPSALPLDGAEPEAFAALLTSAGFADVERRTLDLTWALRDPAPLADLMIRFLGLGACGDAVVKTYADRVGVAVRERNEREGNSSVPNPAILCTATRPD